MNILLCLSPSKYLPTFLALIWFLFIMDSSCSKNVQKIFKLHMGVIDEISCICQIYWILLQNIMNYYLPTWWSSKENDQIRIHLPYENFHWLQLFAFWPFMSLLFLYVTPFVSLCHSFFFMSLLFQKWKKSIKEAFEYQGNTKVGIKTTI